MNENLDTEYSDIENELEAEIEAELEAGTKDEIPQPDVKPKTKTQKFWDSTAGFIIYVVLVMGIAFGISKFCIGQVQVEGPSMKPTLYDSERLIVNKLTYRFKKLDRYDIVVFDYKYEKGLRFVKRIIGLPGETVRIDYDGNIYINEVKLKENFGKAIIEDPGIAVDSFTLGEDEYFVLGDNRNNSTDSRMPDVAAVSKSQIYGKAWLRISPIKDFGLIK